MPPVPTFVTPTVTATAKGPTPPANPPTPTRTPQGQATATNTAQPTATSTAVVTPTQAGNVPPTNTPTPIPTATFTPVVVPTPTTTPGAAPTPTNTQVVLPTPTNTPFVLPTAANTQFVLPTATNTPSPLPTATNTTAAGGSITFSGNCTDAGSCQSLIVGWINQARSTYGIASIGFSGSQSSGDGVCVGSTGHSQAMEQSGSIWHEAPGDSPPYTNPASFPNDICGHAGLSTYGENVGVAGGYGSYGADLAKVMDGMMAENPNTPSGCAAIAPSTNHACNILHGAFTQVGVGIAFGPYFSQTSPYLTEDFTG